jgi:hypothetical protein
MRDVEQILCLMAIFAVLLALLSPPGSPLARAWDTLKAIMRAPSNWADRFCEREVSAALEAEPDWAAAADEVGFFDPIPEPLWRDLDNLWTPAEREAYDLTSNQRFIDETDRILKAIEWQQFTQGLDRQSPALARAIRRNGVQL